MSGGITASGTGLAEACIGSVVLPVAEFVEGPKDKQRTKGHDRHAFLANFFTLGREKAEAMAPEQYRAEFASMNLEALPIVVGQVQVEVAMVYNLRTRQGRLLPHVKERGYTGEVNWDEEIAGTADVFVFSPDQNLVVIIDWKTYWADVPPAKVNPQLEVLALAACAATGADRALVAIARNGDDGETYFDTAEWDAFDLDGVALGKERLIQRRLLAREAYAKGIEPPLYLGEHCGYCKAIARCSAQTGLIRSAAGLELEPLPPPDGTEAMLPVPVSPEAAAEAWMRLDLLEKAARMARRSLELYGKETPFTLPNGMVVGPVAVTKEKVLGAKAFPLLEKHFDNLVKNPELARKAALRACKFTSSKAGIKTAIQEIIMPVLPKPEKGRITQKSVNDPLLASLRENRAIAATTSVSVREHKRGRTLLEDETEEEL